jgi:hypothetical protein
MHCKLLLIVVNQSVWEDHEFDFLEPLCIIPLEKDLPAQTQQPQKQPDAPMQHDPPRHPDPPSQPDPQPEPQKQPDPAVQPDPQKQQPDPAVQQPDPFDIFDNEEKYVGVDDEHVYIPVPLQELTHLSLLMMTMKMLLLKELFLLRQRLMMQILRR